MIAQDKGNKYDGKYIALDGFNGDVIAYDKDPGKLIKKVRKMGIEIPKIVFVPDPKVTYIFSVAS